MVFDHAVEHRYTVRRILLLATLQTCMYFFCRKQMILIHVWMTPKRLTRATRMQLVLYSVLNRNWMDMKMARWEVCRARFYLRYTEALRSLHFFYYKSQVYLYVCLLGPTTHTGRGGCWSVVPNVSRVGTLVVGSIEMDVNFDRRQEQLFFGCLWVFTHLGVFFSSSCQHSYKVWLNRLWYPVHWWEGKGDIWMQMGCTTYESW